MSWARREAQKGLGAMTATLFCVAFATRKSATETHLSIKYEQVSSSADCSWTYVHV